MNNADLMTWSIIGILLLIVTIKIKREEIVFLPFPIYKYK